MKQLDDDSLLRGLGAALCLDVSPSPQEIDDLRELVISSEFHAVVVPMVAPRRPARLARVAAVAAAVVLGAVGVAALAGTSMPNSMRDPARAVGFPVESQEMNEARSAVGQLRAALAQGNDGHVVVAADLLRARLRAVSRDELRQLEPEATDLLRQADARLQPPSPPVTADTGYSESDAIAPSPVATPAPTAASAPEKESSRDDKASESESGKASESESGKGAED